MFIWVLCFQKLQQQLFFSCDKVQLNKRHCASVCQFLGMGFYFLKTGKNIPLFLIFSPKWEKKIPKFPIFSPNFPEIFFPQVVHISTKNFPSGKIIWEKIIPKFPIFSQNGKIISHFGIFFPVFSQSGFFFLKQENNFSFWEKKSRFLPKYRF